MVAGHDHQLAPGERLADPGQGGGAGVEHLGQRAVAELEHVAEQDQPLDVLELRQQQLPEARAAQQVTAAAEPEVEVGDHGRAHAGMVPTVADATIAGRMPPTPDQPPRPRSPLANLLGAGARGAERMAAATGIDEAVERTTEEAIVRALESPAVERAIVRVLESEAAQEALERTLSSPGGRTGGGQGARLRARRRRLGSPARLRRGPAAGRADRRGSRGPGRDRRPGRRADQRPRSPGAGGHPAARRRPRAARPQAAGQTGADGADGPRRAADPGPRPRARPADTERHLPAQHRRPVGDLRHRRRRRVTGTSPRSAAAWVGASAGRPTCSPSGRSPARPRACAFSRSGSRTTTDRAASACAGPGGDSSARSWRRSRSGSGSSACSPVTTAARLARPPCGLRRRRRRPRGRPVDPGGGSRRAIDCRRWPAAQTAPRPGA